MIDPKIPDWFEIESNKAQSYKQIGNSVSVPVLVGLARGIVKFTF
jgi:site-specific DNA-cytosine methylase